VSPIGYDRGTIHDESAGLFREGGKLFFQIQLFVPLVVADSRSTKQFEHFGVRVDRRGIVNQRTAKLCRVFVVLSTLAAWLSISNHCAFGAVIAAQDAMAPMHCHGGQSTPSKKSSGEEMPCCKVLRATVTSQEKLVEAANKVFLPIPNGVVTELIFADEAHLQLVPLELDIGPPVAVSFAESVLQRSLLAHAPPLSLS
jgi:hypothetical protein